MDSIKPVISINMLKNDWPFFMVMIVTIIIIIATIYFVKKEIMKGSK